MTAAAAPLLTAGDVGGVEQAQGLAHAVAGEEGLVVAEAHLVGEEGGEDVGEGDGAVLHEVAAGLGGEHGGVDGDADGAEGGLGGGGAFGGLLVDPGAADGAGVDVVGVFDGGPFDGVAAGGDGGDEGAEAGARARGLQDLRLPVHGDQVAAFAVGALGQRLDVGRAQGEDGALAVVDVGLEGFAVLGGAGVRGEGEGVRAAAVQGVEGAGGVGVDGGCGVARFSGAPALLEVAELAPALALVEGGFVRLPLFATLGDEGIDVGGGVGRQGVVGAVVLLQKGSRFHHGLAGAVAQFIHFFNLPSAGGAGCAATAGAAEGRA